MKKCGSLAPTISFATIQYDSPNTIIANRATTAIITYMVRGPKLNRYENGTIKTIPTDKLRRLADVLGYSFEDFISGDPRYSMMIDGNAKESQVMRDEDDEMLINWFHGLSKEYQSIVKQIISIDSKTEH